MNKKQNPLVSIVCESFNHEPYLRQCLDGFVMQKTNFAFEILIHDDASSDKSQDIIREYIAKYPEQDWQPILQTENQWSKGVGIWRNIQFPRAQGKYIAICEGDDYWTDPLKLQKQIDILEGDPSLMGCCTNRCLVDKYGVKYEDGKAYLIPGKKSCRVSLRDFFKYNVLYPTASVVFRNNHYEEVQQKFAHMKNPYLGDWTLWIAVHCFGDFYYLDEVTCAYRQNPTSVTHTQWKKNRVDKVKSEFDLQPRIADVLPEEYADIAADIRNTNWVHGALVKAYYKDKAYLKMVGQLFVVAVKFPQYYKGLVTRVLNKIKRKLHIK